MADLKIEVVTPVHNRKELTLLCLNSIRHADLGRMELHDIAVDDGSTVGASQALAGRKVEGRWAMDQQERPLSEVYKTTA